MYLFISIQTYLTIQSSRDQYLEQLYEEFVIFISTLVLEKKHLIAPDLYNTFENARQVKHVLALHFFQIGEKSKQMVI